MSQIITMYQKYRHWLGVLLLCLISSSEAAIITTIAGSNSQGYQGDGGLAQAAQLNKPTRMIIDAQGNLLVADTANSVIRQISRSGMISTLAGTGTAGYYGDGALATAAQLNAPSGLALDSRGTLYISDTQNHLIRKITQGIISTVAGTGTAGYSGDYKTAARAQLNQPTALAVDAEDNLYIADTGNSLIRKIDNRGTITTVAGTGQSGRSEDGILATRAILNRPEGIAIVGKQLFIADTQNSVIRVVDAQGIIRTFAGNGERGINAENTFISLAQFNQPSDLIADKQGNLYIVDVRNAVIRYINVQRGEISIFAGNRTQGYSGDGKDALFAQFNLSSGIAIDDANLYIADTYNHVIRKISTRTADSAQITPLSAPSTRVQRPPIQVKFSITDVFGNPLTAYPVTFYTPGNQEVSSTAVTNDYGEVAVAVSYRAVGQYPVIASLGNYVAAQAIIKVSDEEPTFTTPTTSNSSTNPSVVPQVLYLELIQGNTQRVAVTQSAEPLLFAVKNAAGMPIRNQEVRFTVTPTASLTTTTATSDAQGEVTVTFTAPETVGEYLVTAQLVKQDTITAVAHLTVFQPDPVIPPVVPQSLVVTSGDKQIIKTNQSSAEIRFTLTDSNAQPMAGKVLTFSVQPQGQIILPTATDARGEVSITFQADDKIGDYLITAQLQDSLLTAKAQVTVFKPVLIPTPTTLVALKTEQILEVEHSLPLYFTVLDENGKPLAGQTVLFNLAPAAAGLSVVEAVSDSNGQVSTVLQPIHNVGDYAVTANILNTAIRATSTVHTFLPDKPEPLTLTIKPTRGDNQTISLGQNSADITFQVTTLQGSPVVKRQVFFQLSPISGQLAFNSATTDMQGYVTTRLDKATEFGRYIITATISDTATTATAAITVFDPRISLQVVKQMQQVEVLQASEPIRFIATYRQGDPVVNREVTFSLQPTGHQLTQIKALTDSQGQVMTQMNPTDLTGRYVVTATLENAKAQAVIQVTTQPNDEMIAVVSGAEQHILSGEASNTVTFVVTDGAGKPLAGQSIEFTANPAAELVTRFAITDENGQVQTQLSKNTRDGSYEITATTQHGTSVSTTITAHQMVAAVLKQRTEVSAIAPNTSQPDVSKTGFFSGVLINNKVQKNVPVSVQTKLMVVIKDALNQGKKTNIYVTAKKSSAKARTRAATTDDAEWMLVADSEQAQAWQWQPWDGELNNLQPTESNVYLSQNVTQTEYPTEFPSEGEWEISIGYSPPVVDTETPATSPNSLIVAEQTTEITVDKMPSLGESVGLDKENNPVVSSSTFSGGISIENASYVREATTLRSRSVQVEGNVMVESAHVGYLADIIVVVAYRESSNSTDIFYMMQNSNDLLPWDMKPATLVAFQKNVELPSSYPITLYTGNFPVIGELRFYFGYRLSNGTLIFATNSINAKVDDETQMPSLGATMEIGKTTATVQTHFIGGVSQNGQTFVTTAQLPRTQSVQVTGVMNVATEHVGKSAEVLMVVGYTAPDATQPQYFMQDEQHNFQVWQDLNPTSLVARQQQVLTDQVTVDLYQGVLPVLGKIHIYFGYRLSGGSVFYPSLPIELIIH